MSDSHAAPFGRHRAKISPFQTPSAETMAYAKELNSHELGPGQLALSEWAELGLELPDLAALRQFRLERIREKLKALDYAGIVLYDPLNVRYATDSTNMQLWTAHNAVRYCFVATEGPVVLFDFHHCGHLSVHLDLVDEVRPGKAWYYFGAGTDTLRLPIPGRLTLPTWYKATAAAMSGWLSIAAMRKGSKPCTGMA